ncbi:KH domain-containing protein [Priestia megaterium]
MSLFGVEDANLRRIEEEMQVSIISKGETVVVSGSTENVQLVEEMLKK